MLLTDLQRAPHALGDPDLSVRSAIAALFLARKVSLHFLARRNDIALTDRWLILFNARTVESLCRRYEALAAELNFDYLIINTRLLDIAACSIASHVIKGEHEEARRRRDEALNAEAEWSEKAVRAARSRSASAESSPQANASTRLRAA